MTTILGKAKSVHELLHTKKYQIDRDYQRDYKWEQKHIRELIEDLTARFLQGYDQRSSDERAAVDEYGQYFLGSVIISEKDNKRFIVDGQQRLTSLTLLFIYLNQLQQDQNIGDEAQVDVANLIYSKKRGRKSFNLDVPEWRPCLQNLMSRETPDATSRSLSIQNLIKRFGDIEEIFPDELRNEALPYFLDWLTDNVILVEITTSSNDDAYTIFETMNDRGLSLAPTDMLKGYLLAKINSDEDRAHAEDVWKSQMDKLRDLGKDEDTDCIKTWLRSQYAEKIRERKAGAKPEDFDKQGTEFHRWVRENNRKIELTHSNHFMSFVTKKFKFYAEAYIKARQATKQYPEAKELTPIFFNSQNNFTLQYPLMLAPLQITDDEETIRRKIALVATFIEIMLARRIWNNKAINHSTMQYRAFLIMKGIRGKELEALRDDLTYRLSPEGADLDDYFDFQTKKTFHLHGANGRQVHRLLARLTEFLEKQSGRAPRYPEYATRGKGGYQIEHIWADHPKRHEDEFSTPEDFAIYRNRIGGLVLLPAADNASYSDKTYEEKIDLYSQQNLLASSLHSTTYKNNPGFNNFLEATQLPFRPKGTFRKSDLEERQDLYIALADLCWSPSRLNEI